MPVYGRNPYPRRYGGGRRTHEIEHQAILDRLAPGWDVAEETAIYAEVYAQAIAVSVCWAINTRLRRCLIPAGMPRLTVETWEEAMRLRPLAIDTIVARRRAIAARLLGIAGNTITDIEATASALLGPRFVELRVLAEADTTTYWPGINPGPPGNEWASNRCAFAIVVTQLGDTDAERARLIGRLYVELEAMAPAWMTFVVGTGEDCTAGLAVAGLTLI